MKRYEKYKPSGVEWIGDVPEGWGKMRFKNFITLKTDASNSDVKIGLENIESATGKFIETETEFEGNGVAFSTNDIVYGKLRPYLQKVWIAEFNGNAVGDFFVFRTQNNSCPNFVKYLMLSDCFTKLANSATEGAKMPRVSSDFILCLDYFLPPLPEQTAIAAYLDAKCAKIDNVVAVQQKRIELLKELKQSIITHAVTRGLDKNAKFKPSGVDWIGDVPEGWEVAPLKRFLSEAMKYGANAPAEEENNLFPRYIRITDIDENGKLKDDDIKSLNNNDSKDYMLEKGDLLFARSGATVGKTYLFDENYRACYAGYLIKAKCDKKLLPKFVVYYTQSSIYDNWKSASFIQSTIQNISAEKYSMLPMLVPPLPEQTAIATYLDKKCAIIDRQIAKVEKQIELLKEYKQSVITECVTGKRKVC